MTGENPSVEQSCDDFLGGAIRVWQPKKGFRAGVDAVLMAASVPAKEGERVLDLGCGVGTAALCLLARVPKTTACGLELQSVLYRLALKNRVENAFEARFTALNGDILKLADAEGGRLEDASFDHVMCNPPFMPPGRSNPSEDPIRLLANHEGEASLEDWIHVGLRLLKHKGTLTLIHRSDRLGDILSILQAKKAGDIHVCPLWPASGEPAKRVLVRARRSVRTPMTLLPGVVMHQKDGSYPPEIRAVLAEGAALPF
ncbi:tRNA1(Val) (adenine(37)-N6)-methyltransferase [Kiloniella sp. b19]|uniref:tRNA1(Val) (adenine(37)-N6)-methyltransferase n=1 Tax=Kiloniella sp. GXU_MW_B19 TaxID=3141326 RepID=UPI0031DD2727